MPQVHRGKAHHLSIFHNKHDGKAIEALPMLFTYTPLQEEHQAHGVVGRFSQAGAQRVNAPPADMLSIPDSDPRTCLRTLFARKSRSTGACLGTQACTSASKGGCQSCHQFTRSSCRTDRTVRWIRAYVLHSFIMFDFAGAHVAGACLRVACSICPPLSARCTCC